MAKSWIGNLGGAMNLFAAFVLLWHELIARAIPYVVRCHAVS